MKLSNKTVVISAGVFLIILIMGYWAYYCSQNEVMLLSRGRAEFFRGDFFHRDRFSLEYRYGAWEFSRKELGGGELIVPFECKYNKYRDLRLEDNGKVYMIDRKQMSRIELRVVNGEWSYDASSHWQSIFDL